MWNFREVRFAAQLEFQYSSIGGIQAVVFLYDLFQVEFQHSACILSSLCGIPALELQLGGIDVLEFHMLGTRAH